MRRLFCPVLVLTGLLLLVDAVAPRTISTRPYSRNSLHLSAGQNELPTLAKVRTAVSASVISSWLTRRDANHQDSATSKNDRRVSRLLAVPMTFLFSSRARLKDSVSASANDPDPSMPRNTRESRDETAHSSIHAAIQGSSIALFGRRRNRRAHVSRISQRSSTLARSVETVVLEDVTSAVGISQPIPSLKFGGPFVGDLDGDGNYDLVLSFHNGIRTRIYFGESDGIFSLADFIPIHRDVHGVTAAHRTAHTRDSILAISVGGGMGKNLKEPEIYAVSPERVLTDISKGYGLGQIASRGRNTVFMELSMLKKWQKRVNKGGPDMVVTNFLGPSSVLRQYAYENFKGEFKLRDIAGFQFQARGRVEVTDVNNDGIMELISVRNLQFYRLVEPFMFEDVSEELLPEGFEVPPLSVGAVAEIDIDNDGDFDLYVARSDRTLITNRPELEDDDLSDYLLENRNGKYVDISEGSGILTGTNSMGVTTGDLNNDGYVDLVVIKYNEPDVVLLNNGDGTFRQEDGLIPKSSSTVGNHAVAVDYDLDGRIDVIVGHGDVDTINGTYLVMKNQLPLTENSHYLLVEVANEPSRGATAINAVVTVFVGGQRLTRRVGSRGAQGGGASYITTVHFGIGSFTTIECVRVRWTNGANRKMMDVAADQKILFGVR